MSDAEQPASGISLIRRVLTDRSVPPIASDSPLSEMADGKQTFDDIVAVREILKQFAAGNFEVQITVRGVLAGYLKTLQANMRHLSWQVEQVADGDFSQRVDFMGSFSKAFNTLTERLESSLQKLKEQEVHRRSTMLLDSIAGTVFFFNENLALTDVNLAAAKMFGFTTREQLLAATSHIANLSPKYQPDGRLSSDESGKKLSEALEKGKAVFLWTHQSIDGGIIPAEVTLSRIDWGGKPGIVGSIQDLRELTAARLRLEQQQQEFHSILNSSPVCLTILTEEGFVRYATPFMQNFIGIKLHEKLQDYFGDASLADYMMAEVKEHTIQWRQVSVKTKQGEIKEMLVNMFPLEYYNEQSIIMWLIDITKIREYETELITARNTAENLARIKGEFLSNVSHEIKTPMNAIIGLIHLINDTNLTERQSNFIKNIEISSNRLLRIISNILDFSEMENDELTLSSGEFSLDDLLKDIEQNVRRQCDEQQLEFSIERESSLPPFLIGDAARLRQILEHLLDNAVKFTYRGSICLKIKSAILETSQLELFITVSDTGIGMSETDLQNIFTPFIQADGSRTRSFGGIGLGLSICQMLVKKMGGIIWAESQAEKGTNITFTTRFEVPSSQKELQETLAEPLDDENEDITASGIIVPNRLQGDTILLVDDNSINQIVAAELLKKKGFRIDIASNGKQAVEKVKQNKYALVLMDIQMPVMDGTEATILIRQLPDRKDLPIVALTANDSEADCKEYYAAGMNGVLGKPVNPVLLYNTVIRLAKGDRA